MIYPSNYEHKIGFNEIRSLLRERCLCPLGREKVDELAFSDNIDEVREWLNQVHEFRIISDTKDDFPLDHFYDVREAVTRIRLANTHFEEQEVFDLRRSLETIVKIVTYLRRGYDDGDAPPYPALFRLTEGVVTFPAMLRRIDSILDKFGKIKDGASMTLAGIRHELKKTEGSISRTLYSILHTAQRDGFVDKDAAPTLRDGRLMIPVAPGLKRKINGIVHDESATGKTVFIEPAEVVEANNRIRELEAEERREMIRILTVFSDEVRPHVKDILDSYQFLATIDLIQAKCGLASLTKAIEPTVVEQPSIDWIRAIHPLLAISLEKQGKQVVPLDIMLKPNPSQRDGGLDSSTDGKGNQSPLPCGSLLIISGPNAGGKSVLLKAVGLIQYMLQCGMPVPLRPTSECGMFGSIFIDIGDQQSIDNDLSTYTSHLQNMKTLLAEAKDDTLFLLDELGGGTEPRSGCAIAEAVLEELYNKGAFGVVTTHFADLKLLADRMPAVANGAMLFDTDQMRPLYRLNIGHPGSSFAFEIAESIGFPKEVLDRAGEMAGREPLHFAHQLQQLELDKKEIERKKEELRVADEFLAEVTEKYQRLNDNLQSRRHEIIGSARREAQQILTDANRTVERTISDIKSAKAEKEATRKAREALSEATEQNTKALTEQSERTRKSQVRINSDNSVRDKEMPILVGSIVRIDGEETFGEVVEIKGKKAVVESNSVRMTIPLSRLQGTAKQKIPTDRKAVSVSRGIYDDMNEKRAHFNPTLDLRGHRAEEAINELHQFLDTALLLSEKEVRILHGKGYGILMQIIQQELKASRDVRTFHPEKLELGGAGITVVELR